jgi:ribosome maturation factor RimP
MSDLKTTVTGIVGPVAEELGLELFDVEIAGAHHAPIVRVFLDREGGIDMDAIAKASRAVSEALEEADPIEGAYTLEVSSPGIDRPLRHLDDVRSYAGHTARFQLKEALDPVEGRRRVTGRIIGVTGTDVTVDAEEAGVVTIPWGAVTTARLKGDVDVKGRDDR